VDIIDNMSLKFAELEPTCDDEDEDTNRISTAVLDEIYAEFQDFALKKDALITQRIPQKE
jgi:predicted DNA binding CopG/RHH family protein